MDFVKILPRAYDIGIISIAYVKAVTESVEKLPKLY